MSCRRKDFADFVRCAVSRVTGRVVIALGLLTLCGCGLSNQIAGPEDSLFNDNRVNPAGANQLLPKSMETFDDTQLHRLICPRPGVPENPSLVDAIDCFQADGSYPGLTGDALALARKSRRNEAQSTLILASNQRCNLWFTYVERADSINRALFNILSTVTGGVGAIVSGTAASALSATSGIASGTGAAIDAALLHGITEGVLFPAIVAARNDKMQKISENQTKPTDQYPLAAALADAIEYHGLCNFRTALDKGAQVASFTVGNDALAKAVEANRQVTLALSGGFALKDSDLVPGAVFRSKGALLRIVTVAADGTITYETSLNSAAYGGSQSTPKAQFKQLVDRTVCSPSQC